MNLGRKHPPQDQLERDPDWYRCVYLLAVANVNLALAQDSDPALAQRSHVIDPRDRANDYAAQLALAIEEELVTHHGEGRDSSVAGRQAKEFLQALEPTALTLLAGILRRWSPPPTRGDLSFESAALQEQRVSLVKALQSGEPFEHRSIVRLVERLHLDFRARYNLACYYAGVAQESETPHYERAFSELRAALLSAPLDLVKWTLTDPALASLRQDDTYGRKVNGLVDSLAQPADEMTDREASR